MLPETLSISGSQCTIQRSQAKFRALQRRSVQLAASQPKPNELRAGHRSTAQLIASRAVQNNSREDIQLQQMLLVLGGGGWDYKRITLLRAVWRLDHTTPHHTTPYHTTYTIPY